MTDKEFWKIVDKYGWSVETDNEGQIVLYTGLMFSDENEITPWVDSEGEQE